MPVKKPKFNPITSWSYSVYTQYIRCPFSVCLEKVQRIQMAELPNPAFIKGDRVHKSAENFVRAPKAPPLEPELAHLKPMLTVLRKAKAKVELEWAFNREWKPTSWFARDTWLRIKTDVCQDSAAPPLVNIIDYKTGKVYPDHKQQRSLYALGGLLLVKLGLLAGGSTKTKLTAQHVYVDTKQEATEQFTMKNLEPLQREWLARTDEMLKDTEFKAIEGRHCGWCKFRKSAGGPCPANQ